MSAATSAPGDCASDDSKFVDIDGSDVEVDDCSTHARYEKSKKKRLGQGKQICSMHATKQTWTSACTACMCAPSYGETGTYDLGASVILISYFQQLVAGQTIHALANTT